MVESSKILTVSYGTFSCTLEGFDDSFGTMKAIAEYFRDLAQGDRYFGAEPPAPDAEMLTRIAEKEIARRVEARADESGIVLRAVDAQQAPAMPPVATPPAVDDVAEAQEQADIAEHEAEADIADEADAAVESADADTAEIAETTHAATADMDGDVAGPEVEENTSSTLVASSPATPEFANVSIDDEMDVTAPAASFDDMAPDAINAVPAHPDADSVAAKLQRIRAVVGGGAVAEAETAEADISDSFEDNHSEPEEALSADVAEDAASEEAIFEDVENVELEGQADIESDVTEDAAAHDVADFAESTDDNAEAVDEDVADASEDIQEDVAEDAIADAPNAEGTSDADTSTDEEEVAEVETPKQNFRARILRVAKKTRLLPIEDDTEATQPDSVTDQPNDDATASDDEPASIFEDIDAEEVAELAPADNAAITALSEEDEAELLADLAEVEADVADTAPVAAEIIEDVADIEQPEVVAEDVASEEVAPAGRDILPEADDAAMSRIMDEADEQLSEPEGSRRRSAIAQLKAAVAATEAARQLGDKGDDAAAKESAFRDDLNDAVRPGSSTDLPRTEVRAERPRPAPLKLVASQRVNEEDASETEDAPVLPRRVSAGPTADTESFAEFATEMGATELPDLLEAAAAYTAYVEGVEDFSRPQIMKKVQASSKEEFSREDGLRSFGTLLRQGRISKVRNGRFQVSDQTRFKPEQKAG